VIITIDGPAGAGKSTVAKALAQRLGFRYLDTGSMYRAVALAGWRRGVDWQNPQQLAEVAGQVRLEVQGDRILLDGEDVTEAVRTSEITAVTRFSADNPQIRQRLVELQRRTADRDNVITEGRDQGTVVFPHADFKFFLTASPQQRAARRQGDLAAQGESRSLPEILADINRRDLQDAARPVGPLRRADDAMEVDTDRKTVEEVVDFLERLVRHREDKGRDDRT
jgi:cytidylate kinase